MANVTRKRKWLKYALGGVETDEFNGEFTPKPGEVHAALDEATAAGGGVVTLQSDQTYDPSSPYEVTEKVIVDCNGATIDLSTDTDVFHIHAGGLVLRPRVNYESVTYTSAVYTYDASITASPYGTFKETGVRGGETIGTAGEGTVFAIHQNGASDRVTFVENLDHRIAGCGTAIDIHSENVDGWTNTNTFTGRFAQAETCIHQHGPGGNKYNEFKFSYQPNTNGDSAIFWDLSGAKAEGNIYDGILWDTHSYTDIVWRIGSSVDANNIIRSETPVGYSDVDNQSSTKQTLHSASDRSTLSPGYAAGDNAEAAEARNTAVGAGAAANETRSTAIGEKSAAADAAVAVGQNTNASGTASTAIGRNSDATANYAGVFGYNNSNPVARTFRIGDSSYIKQVYMAGIRDTIADADLPAEHLTIELDETNGGFRLRGKDSGGTVRETLLTW